MLWPDAPLDHVKLEQDPDGLHIGAFWETELVGVGSFFLDGAAARLRKLAVLPKMQGQGIGSRIIAEGANALRARQVSELWCNARCTATGFYGDLGFQIDPLVFMKSGEAYKRARLHL